VDSDGRRGCSQCGNAGESGLQFTVFLFEIGDTRVGGRELLFKLQQMAAIFRMRARLTPAFFSIGGFGCRKRRCDRRKVHFRKRARGSDAFAAFRRARAVEGAERWEGDAVEDAVLGGPEIGFSALQAWEIGKNALAFLLVGLALDPRADRVAVLARGQLHGDQDAGVRKHILVHDGRALRDQLRDETARAAAAHDFFDMAEKAFPAFDRPLRRP
jgi:hypothetical protein